MLTVILENMKLYYQLLCKTHVFIFSIKVDENIPYEKNPKTAISIQMSLNERY